MKRSPAQVRKSNRLVQNRKGNSSFRPNGNNAIAVKTADEKVVVSMAEAKSRE